MKRPLIAALFALTCSGLAACTKSDSPGTPHFLTQHVGEYCTVQFRRDALGAGASLPISPTTSNINGSSVTQEGKLLAVEREGIVIEVLLPSAKTACWIPYGVILSVEPAGR